MPFEMAATSSHGNEEHFSRNEDIYKWHLASSERSYLEESGEMNDEPPLGDDSACVSQGKALSEERKSFEENMNCDSETGEESFPMYSSFSATEEMHSDFEDERKHVENDQAVVGVSQVELQVSQTIVEDFGLELGVSLDSSECSGGTELKACKTFVKAQGKDRAKTSEIGMEVSLADRAEYPPAESEATGTGEAEIAQMDVETSETHSGPHQSCPVKITAGSRDAGEGSTQCGGPADFHYEEIANLPCPPSCPSPKEFAKMCPNHSAFLKNKKSCRRVSFPSDSELVTKYVEPLNPWQGAVRSTGSEASERYCQACAQQGAKPISKLASQLKLEVHDSDESRIEKLDLSGEVLDFKQCEALEEIFRRLQFNRIDLESASLEEDEAVALFDMLEFYDSAIEVSVGSSKDFGPRGWKSCAKFVKKSPCLERLDLRGCSFADSNLLFLTKALRYECTLRSLHMEGCHIKGRSLIILATSLQMNKSIQELYLANNGLSPTDAVQLGNLLRANITLQLLDLRNNELQDPGVGHLCDGLCKQGDSILLQSDPCQLGLRGLNTLILWNNHLTFNSGNHFHRALEHCKTLETLNVGHNPLTNEGVLRMKQALMQSRCLRQLGLQGTKVSCEGAVAIAEIIAENKILERVDLRDNGLKVAGLIALKLSLNMNYTLTQLDLDEEPKKEPVSEMKEKYVECVKEVKQYCERNRRPKLFPVPEHSEEEEGSKEKVEDPSLLSEDISPVLSSQPIRPPFLRKISLTCDTLSPPAASSSDLPTHTEEEENEKRKLVSPEPSPMSSPINSAIPFRTGRFQVFNVADSSNSLLKVTQIDGVPPLFHSLSDTDVTQLKVETLSEEVISTPIDSHHLTVPTRMNRFRVTRVTESDLPNCTPLSSSVPTPKMSRFRVSRVEEPRPLPQPEKVSIGFTTDENKSRSGIRFAGGEDIEYKNYSFSVNEKEFKLTTTSTKEDVLKYSADVVVQNVPQPSSTDSSPMNSTLMSAGECS
ncbi:unnamed protein product [Darwinula stevensoni]|uniref:Protein phosphatase 1 regulatory subunit 37 n=1 Tax=Darwinula stevensoni TaxID=69355 RepID=A0A7R8XJM2_9CRUS|nr:unnamed protein product [Darwinula stevensoni]CAG0892369.1 unnamed protein product [Darwinula stevensoni]